MEIAGARIIRAHGNGNALQSHHVETPPFCVLGVDRARRRISLSLRSDQRKAARPDAPKHTDRIDGPSRRPGVALDDIPGRGGSRPSARPSMDRGRPPAANVSRAQALADLEALFKKK